MLSGGAIEATGHFETLGTAIGRGLELANQHTALAAGDDHLLTHRSLLLALLTGAQGLLAKQRYQLRFSGAVQGIDVDQQARHRRGQPRRLSGCLGEIQGILQRLIALQRAVEDLNLLLVGELPGLQDRTLRLGGQFGRSDHFVQHPRHPWRRLYFLFAKDAQPEQLHATPGQRRAERRPARFDQRQGGLSEMLDATQLGHAPLRLRGPVDQQIDQVATGAEILEAGHGRRIGLFAPKAVTEDHLVQLLAQLADDFPLHPQQRAQMPRAPRRSAAKA